MLLPFIFQDEYIAFVCDLALLTIASVKAIHQCWEPIASVSWFPELESLKASERMWQSIMLNKGKGEKEMFTVVYLQGYEMLHWSHGVSRERTVGQVTVQAIVPLGVSPFLFYCVSCFGIFGVSNMHLQLSMLEIQFLIFSLQPCSFQPSYFNDGPFNSVFQVFKSVTYKPSQIPLYFTCHIQSIRQSCVLFTWIALLSWNLHTINCTYSK